MEFKSIKYRIAYKLIKSNKDADFLLQNPHFVGDLYRIYVLKIKNFMDFFKKVLLSQVHKIDTLQVKST